MQPIAQETGRARTRVHNAPATDCQPFHCTLVATSAPPGTPPSAPRSADGRRQRSTAQELHHRKPRQRRRYGDTGRQVDGARPRSLGLCAVRWRQLWQADLGQHAAVSGRSRTASIGGGVPTGKCAAMQRWRSRCVGVPQWDGQRWLPAAAVIGPHLGHAGWKHRLQWHDGAPRRCAGDGLRRTAKHDRASAAPVHQSVGSKVGRWRRRHDRHGNARS